MAESKKERKRVAILGILQASPGPRTSAEIARELSARGQEISERTVRLYLESMDEAGQTENLGRQGRRITEEGLAELGSSRALERVGYLSAKIDQMIYRMDFDLATRRGTVVVNMTVVDPAVALANVDMIGKVFSKGYSMGRLVTVLPPGTRHGGMIVPKGRVGIGTVCSITLNGVLLKHGVPMHSRFGGLLELKKGRATRFLEIINYEGTSLDPLEVFIRSKMTDYIGAVTTGTGRIGAGFREIPGEGRDAVVQLARRLDEVGLGGFMTIGYPNESVLDIPVNTGVAGIVVIGGLNPMAIIEEQGLDIQSRALAGLVEYGTLFEYDLLAKRLREYA